MKEVSPIRYKLVNETITFFLSNREVVNYDPDVLNLPETLAKIDSLAERKGYSVRMDSGVIQTFGQNELARRILRYANAT